MRHVSAPAPDCYGDEWLIGFTHFPEFVYLDQVHEQGRVPEASRVIGNGSILIIDSSASQFSIGKPVASDYLVGHER